ncbi:MAG TPA: beta-propeller domain-containing protein [Myxococcaceae bacterium]|jgi:hypothetical protein
MKWMRFGSLGLALVAAGCDSGSEDTSLPPNLPVQQVSRLESFEKCEDLESYIEDTAVTDMRAQLGWQRDQIGRWGGGGGPVMEDGSGGPQPGAPTSGDSGGGAGAPRGPDNHTDTNNQVAGVDEADFVKNDGTRIFVVSGRKLYVHQSWPAEALKAVGSVQLEGYPREMFLSGQDRAVIFSGITYQEDGQSDGSSKPGGGVSAGDVACMPGACGYYGRGATKITVVDVSNLASPQVVDELYLPGNYFNARRTQDTVRVLLSDNFRWPQEMKWWPEYEDGLWEDKEKLKKKFDEMIVQNAKLIRGQTLAQWLPSGWRKRPDGSKVAVGYDCRDFQRSSAPSKLGFVTVATLNLDSEVQETTVRRTSLVADPGEIYATSNALYMSSRHWWRYPEDGQRDHTYLHKFDTSEPGVARYVASGVVEGYLLNQFSMDEHQEVLRVATTITTLKKNNDSPWWWWSNGNSVTTSRVTTFKEKGGQLVQVGKSAELAEDERIYSARFMGNKGYVVTFRQVDPLFTFDLSDPANPRKVGELKVPGFSNYIHPISDTHLITIGVHVSEDPNNWRERYVKLSMFDVSNLAQPQEVFTHQVGTAYGWSEALYEHKAFNYFAAKGLLAIPFSDYNPASSDYWTGFRSELKVFRVDTATGFTPVGAVSVADMYRIHNYRNWSYYWTPNVRRSVMADDYVYAISDAGVRVAHVSNLAAPLATTHFAPDFNFYP